MITTDNLVVRVYFAIVPHVTLREQQWVISIIIEHDAFAYVNKP